jgi:DNA-binding PadR family transcriptional regulator
MVVSQIIPQEGRPNRKLYEITDAGRAELHQWTSTPLPFEVPRQAWLIQVFFAHSISNEQIVGLFEKRIADLREYLSRCHLAQESIDANYQRLGVKRLRELWQLTLDSGVDYYQNEIIWLEATLPRLHELPPFEFPRE